MRDTEQIKTVVYAHNKMFLEFVESTNGLSQLTFNPDQVRKDRVEPIAYPNFQIGLAGKPRNVFPVPLSGVTSIPYEMKVVSIEKTGEHLKIRYKHEEYLLAVIVEMSFIPHTKMIRQTTTAINEGTEPLTLTQLSSLNINGLATDGIRPWQDPKKIKVHYSMQTWHGEGQWRTSNLEDLGLYHASPHPPACTARFSSLGSFSTAKYLPLIIMEDMETGKVWYFQLETSTSWNLEIGFRGSWSDDGGALYIHTDGGSERFGGWRKQLLPGESYTTVPTAFGCAKGDFNEAVKQLTLYRRNVLKPVNAWDGECPLTYNDFMNGIWGDPTRETLIPLINAAAEAGAECFCIDAGWFHRQDVPQCLGDWLPSEERFGEGGLQGVLHYIQSKGLIPGIWLEMEMCHVNSRISDKPDEWYFFRHGQRIGGPDRVFLNFAHPEVREHLHEVIDRLVGMGVGFIKNDYNDFIPIADSDEGASVDGLRINADSFYAFIDEVRNQHPRLILENCGSGGMRTDYAALSHFHLQSTSDQEFYHNYPSVLQGSLAGIVPEQAGIWVYPYPLPYLDRSTPEMVHTEPYQAMMKDGEQTIFNMVNGLCGNMYMAGHLQAADDLNMGLIKEATSLYKKERKHIRQSYPIYPTGLLKIKDKNTWGSLGLISQDGSRILLAVWRLNSAEEYFEIPLSDWIKGAAAIRQIYPAQQYETSIYYNETKCKLTIRMAQQNQARYYEIMQ